MAVNKVSLKLVIDTERRRVVYAEAGKEFVDFLFNILALPIGTFVPLLNQEMVGGLGNIYDSIVNISSDYLKPNVRDFLLTPKVYISSGTGGGLLELPNVTSTSRKLYGCIYCEHLYDDCSKRCFCRKNGNFTLEFGHRGPPRVNDPYFYSSETGGGCVQEMVMYMVMDDLAVKPLSTVSIISLLDKFNVKDMGTLEEKMVDLGMDEGVKLLKASLLSKSVLTDVFLPMLKQ
ncbi:hypothetical protein SO802_016780 [Lithocarpus litseifolius]|uniref:DUF674 domain-containing protein n=1 Tax=Lithocarpus litseifolius TaxID=425828 RepID=A0AAW2CY54_9ROSI